MFRDDHIIAKSGYENTASGLLRWAENKQVEVDILTADCASLRADKDAFSRDASRLNFENECLREEIKALLDLRCN